MGVGLWMDLNKKLMKAGPMRRVSKMCHSFLSFMIRLLDLNATQNESCIDDIFGQIYSQAFE